MKVICCRCSVVLREEQSSDHEEALISHGLCEPCARHFMAQTGVPLIEYLDGFSEPIVAVTPDGQIGEANRAAQQMLKKSYEQSHGRLIGEVFECEHAQEPEGCGNTIHCSGCAIRNSVTRTANTGEDQLMVPAVLNRLQENDAPARVEMLISTHDVGGVIFLTINPTVEEAIDPE